VSESRERAAIAGQVPCLTGADASRREALIDAVEEQVDAAD
jgi:hypothetical protein